MLNAIYASKLFKSSYRKDRIVSAFNNPLNKELVKQLSKYIPDAIDIDETTTSDGPMPEEAHQNPSSNEPKSNVKHESNKSVMHVNTITRSDDASMTTDTSEVDKDTNLPKDDDVSKPNVEDSISKDTTESKEAATSASSAIKNATQIVNNVYDSFMYIIDPIKSILNIHSDTSGVVRATIKDNELWIYYNDSINLNNIMPNVIDILRAANYDYLEFNRLARSDNAIVFEIVLSNTAIG